MVTPSEFLSIHRRAILESVSLQQIYCIMDYPLCNFHFYVRIGLAPAFQWGHRGLHGHA